MPRNPIAVVISDVHYTLSTLEIADACMRQAIDKAAELKAPLIDCGDITDTKAVIRAEVMNKLLETTSYASQRNVNIFSLVGNHSLVNERSLDAHALGFLPGDYWNLIERNGGYLWFNHRLYAIPYQPDPEKFYSIIQKFPKNSIVFAHQGNVGGDTGDYIQDRSAVDPKLLTEWRVFSGHYHQHYENKNWVSIGNPYTLNYGEAKDPEKGFLIVYDDGSYERVLTKQRRHIVLERHYEEVEGNLPKCSPDDLVWLKLRGPKSILNSFNKKVAASSLGVKNFKLDLIYHENNTPEVKNNFTNEQILDSLIEGLNDTAVEKQYLKKLWRSVLET